MASPGVVVVSGAGTGIGRAVARRLASEGFRVIAVGRCSEPLQQLAEELGSAASLVPADVSTEAGAAAVADALESVSGRCSGIVAAAGGLSPRTSSADSLASIRHSWHQAFESNVLTAVLRVEALRTHLETGAGRVVLVSSIAALRGSGGGPYSGMKAALHGWAYALARELGPHGGTANVVAPGFVPDTEFWAGRLTPDLRQEWAAHSLVG